MLNHLQSEIMAEPERFVEPDPELPLALLDQKEVDKSFRSVDNWEVDFQLTSVMTFRLAKNCF